MKKVYLIIFLYSSVLLSLQAQESNVPDYKWGNASYFNMNIGETVYYGNTEIKLIALQNHFNQFKVGDDTLWIKVSRRSLPVVKGKLRIFVADNKNIKALTEDPEIHGLLTKDALVCISFSEESLLDPKKFTFPISFNDGFIWEGEEDNYLFSYMGLNECYGEKKYRSYPGIDFDLEGARGMEKHWIIAPENSTVVWINENRDEVDNRQASVLLQSESNPWIYYFINQLYKRNLEVREGQKMLRGELIGTAWGEGNRCYVQFSVIKSDTIPSFEPCNFQVLNFFPQLFELYYRNSPRFSKSFEKGTIKFGRDSGKKGSANTFAFEEYIGKGWILGKWNIADKVESVEKGASGNVRLKRIFFANTPAECLNPNKWYDYEINVRNGTYRIRAKTGDLLVPTTQRIAFEGINSGTFSLNKGELKWTSERIVKVTDGKLTVRIYLDDSNELSAGISEIVFQRVN